MKSPISGNEMKIKYETRSLEFRKESFEVKYHFFYCEESGEQFTTTELDNLNLAQLHNQFRQKHNLPFPDDIKGVREKYELSASKMSEILGFGINSYRNYESGEVPTQANARLIQLASDPEKFKDLVELSDGIDGNAREKLNRRIDHLIDQEKENFFSIELRDYLMGENAPNELTGFRKPDINRLTEIVVFFSERLMPFTTKLNKLLFYADFLAFKLSCQSITGARYRAIDRGPVPNNFHGIFDHMARNNHVIVNHVVFENGYEGEQFTTHPTRPFNPDTFTEKELRILEKVADAFKETTTSQIIEISHKEKAWIENQVNKNLISYKDYAFDLTIS